MLQVVWETAENIAKSKSSIDFFLSGCHCKTGCGTRICSCKKKKGNVARVAPAIFLKIQYNLVTTLVLAQMKLTLLLRTFLTTTTNHNYYVEASDDDLDTIRKEEIKN